MTLAMTAALPVCAGRSPLAKSLAAIDLLSGGRLVAALAPGSSQRDYELAGIPVRGALGAVRRGAGA